MDATTNRRFTELYRNSAVFETKQAAITGLYNHELINSLKDGEPLLARYMAYFTWDEGSKQYVLQSTKNDSATFTRIVSNETSITSTKEYIVGDIVNVTVTEGNITTTKSYKCSSIPQGGVAVPVGSNFATSGYFTEITSASVTPQSVKTIRVLMAVATVFEDNSGNHSFKKEPPKGRLTIFEEDDVIREMINKASISSPDGTINISDVVSGKEIQVNLGTSLVKNTSTGVDKGKIDVNFDDRTIKQHPSSHSTLPNKLYVHHGNTIVESDISGEEGKLNVHHGSTLVESSDSEHLGMLDVNTGVTLKVSDGTGSGPASGTIDVYHGATLVESSTSGEVGKLDVRTGTSLKVSNGGSGNPDPGTIDVNIDNQSIKQYASDYATAALQNKLYVNVDNASGLNLDFTNGIQVRLGKALKFRSGETDASASDNGKIDVQYDDNTIGLNGSNQLVTNFHSGTTGNSATMERKSHETEDSIVYDGWGVKHGSTISEDRNGIHVNIDNSTLVSDSITGVISVDPTTIPVFGENAIKVTPHFDNTDPDNPVEDGKTVNLKINTNDKILTQDNNGLLTNITISDVTNSEALPSNVLKRYRLLGKNTASADKDPSYEQIGDAIDIYRDSSLIDVHLGHIGDVLKPESEWAEGHTTPVYPTDYTVATSSNDALCFVYLLADETYQLVAVDVESFLSENEFEDGLQVVRGTYSYSQIHYVPEGITWDSTNSGSSLPSTVDENSPEYYKVDDGTDVTYYKKSSNGVVSVKVGTGIGIDGTSKAIYVNYDTVGATNRPVYWDGTNHTPVQIDYEINKTVPADAVFTDTTYESGNEITIDSTNNHINHDVKLTGGFTPTTSGATISGWGASGSVKIPVLTINQYGHVTNASEATLSITFPEAKITDNTLVWPDYTTTHLSPAWQTVITENAIALNTPYDTAFNKLDKKIKGLADELINAESVWSQAIEDEPRYFAKSSSGAAVTAMTATLVESRNFAIENNKPINGTKVDVYFSTLHTTESATLNINDTGAFPLVYNDSNFDTTLIQSGTTLALVFDKEYNNNTGCYRVVGGVGSGSGSGSTNGITDINAGNGINVTKNYTEVTINSSATPYSSTWFKDAAGSAVITPATSTVYRVITAGNYYNMAYTWDDTNSKYVLSTDIKETVAVKLAANMIPEGSTSGSATEISGLGTLLKFTSNGELAMENTWDCGTY